MPTNGLHSEEPKHVSTTLNFRLDPALGGHTTYKAATAGYFRLKFDVQEVTIYDGRGREGDFRLSTHGFQYHKHPPAKVDYQDPDQIKQVVYPETIELMKEVTGATEVHIYSHLVRQDSREKTDALIKEQENLADDDPAPQVGPARFVHIDVSDVGAEQMLYQNLSPDIAKKLSSTRWAIINLWRPIKTVTKDPLCMCDIRTCRDEDLITMPVLLPPKGSGKLANVSRGDDVEIMVMKHHPEQEWHYISRMEPDETLLIKCWDSLRDGHTARRTPHTSFIDPATQDDPVRESVEVRCLVFYEDQPL
ncbi:uncharacterized protein Z519_01824 [Cladophialophora bantiana CBS 173.52]|uniref:Uncharacterized protein n=1 Tax=Cladophialophora bantiana (strain ATCC 10958 / CBS 173.52 / CDC B-1940 / NIH 8579) TaxID=1442370 RepID=A0A0D2I4N2_CLAB1|nr:uncharacterized protein Z519_01824 [Cladophialophora bantiana CBS 173.52]KIW98240.1 hypothetical protein Z519_01824 [Cladophialophora bantiana CBS 173.52]